MASEPQTDDPVHLKTVVSELQKENAYLREQIKLLKHHRFGPKAETVHPDQLPLLDTDPKALLGAEPKSLQVKAYNRKKRIRLGFADDLPSRRIELDLDEADKLCSCCQVPMTPIGEDITRKVEFIPARAEVIEYARRKYACKQCEGDIKRAQLPQFILPKSFAAPSLLAHLIVSKYADHLPLYRIEKQFHRVGIQLPRSTMCDWLIQIAEKLEPITQAIQKIILSGERIWTDDTIIPLQNDDPNRKRTIQARLWVYIGGPLKDPPLVYYDYSRTRSAIWPLKQLQEYRGYKHADGYAGYKPLHQHDQVKFVACWAHARRKFYEASLLTQHQGRAKEALDWIGRLYQIEHDCKTMNDDDRKDYRNQHAKPHLAQFKAWAESQLPAVLPKSQLGKAFFYMLNHWHGLIRYLDEGYLMPDNNKAEQHIRPIALGRKNYLFIGSDRGGRAAATYYSLVESCKNAKINPLVYLTDVLERLPEVQSEDEIQALIPGFWNLS